LTTNKQKTITKSYLKQNRIKTTTEMKKEAGEEK
jgi:hypothetical protein